MAITTDQAARVTSLRNRIAEYEALSMQLAGLPHNEVQKNLVKYGFRSISEVEGVLSRLYTQLDGLTGGAQIKVGGVTFRG